MKKQIEQLKQAIRDVPDFPKEGILFKDITPVLQDAQLFATAIELFAKQTENLGFELIAAIESRGFIFGAALALKLNKGFVPIRKPGKLPYKTFKEEYQLEYGTDALEIHQDAVTPGQKVLLIDDLLATGGTALASAKLVERCGGKVAAICFLIELTFLNGIQKLGNYQVKTLIKF
ncbi:MAG: adenine phosphoribosyltransferase [Caldisericaceae bacterium]|nr:adenine phosphoribosyltransferase [Caldisericaceae bacterium]